MASTCRVQLAVYDSPCLSHHLSPFENKIGGYPVSLYINSNTILCIYDYSYRTSFPAAHWVRILPRLANVVEVLWLYLLKSTVHMKAHRTTGCSISIAAVRQPVGRSQKGRIFSWPWCYEVWSSLFFFVPVGWCCDPNRKIPAMRKKSHRSQ